MPNRAHRRAERHASTPPADPPPPKRAPQRRSPSPSESRHPCNSHSPTAPAKTISWPTSFTTGREPNMTKHITGTRDEWLAARLDLLEAEKDLTRRSDALA